ncbi:Chemotaxis protein methyltransferase [Roseivivax jejudonensis]|uniref:Chemotaxis protein methyltransferase n=1 Tax=Roseivivax jejudonensis TaxID=1529041 RepID=A0A1X6YUD6_9RHOB|nr:CheR family methyltransferase [Roseivivax jejudonensis]SLN31699.1 Chemotaxis protein methyltransferase [Roseivivax jejudonensis]
MADVSDPVPVTASAGVEFTDADFDAVAELLRVDAGISLGPENRQLVYSRLNRHVRGLGLVRFRDYLDRIRAPGQEAERYRMVIALCTHTTRFFREGEHFDYLATEVMPRLSAQARSGGRVRLWSAGCSTGEEAYSIAATVLGAFPEAARHDVRVLGTDISVEALATAQEGRYRDPGPTAVPDALRAVMFEPDPEPDHVVVTAAVRNLVTFRYLNFMEPWPLSGPFDAIFCRNVAIYMADDTQAHVWAGLEAVLGPEGTLFIGHSERLGPEFRDRLDLCGRTTFCRSTDPRLSSARRMQ